MSEKNLDESILDTLNEEFEKLQNPEEEEEVEESKGGDPESTDSESESKDEEVTEDNAEGELDDGADTDVSSNDDDSVSDDLPADASSEDSNEPEEEITEELRNPPTTWTAQAKSKYEELPSWAKKEIHKRESDSVRGAMALKDKASFADRLSSTIQPYQPLLNQMGITPEVVIKDSLNLAQTLKTGSQDEKRLMLHKIAQQYQVDLTQEVKSNPEVDPLRQELHQVKQTLSQFQQQSVQQQNEAATKMVDEFATETDESGSLSHPYFHNVQEDMRAFLESGRADTLQDAYDKACWADPEIRVLIQTQQDEEKERKRREADSEKTKRAKNANRNNLDSRNKDSLSTKPKGSIDDTLNEELVRIRAEG